MYCVVHFSSVDKTQGKNCSSPRFLVIVSLLLRLSSSFSANVVIEVSLSDFPKHDNLIFPLLLFFCCQADFFCLNLGHLDIFSPEQHFPGHIEVDEHSVSFGRGPRDLRQATESCDVSF